MLQSLSGGITEIPYINDILQNSIKDSQVKPQNIFQVLDADSSQQVVIEAAKRGDSFVVQGPPGTGKSQTIVNMITELIGAGKSV
ncbi:AAA domain-containing protein, partial [Cylindrospermopsis raciborskii]